MFVLYLDEFGHPGPYVPTDSRFAHHPLFGFAGFSIEGPNWRDLDRGFLRLKVSYYSREIQRDQTLRGIRAERWEPKQLRSRRDRRFAADVLGLIKTRGGTLHAYGCVKNSTPATHSYHGLYNSHVQGAIRQYEKFLRDFAGKSRGRGIIIMDRRHENQNRYVLESAQSYLFSDPIMRRPDGRVIETPLLVPSEWYHGVQVADVVGRVVGALFWSRHLGAPGYAWAEKHFGALVDGLTYRIDGWRSVFVKP